MGTIIILMPGMNGYAVCQHLKNDPLRQHIPIIFLSVLDLPEQKIQAFRAGAVDYITKPFESEEVVARVHTHLQLTQIEGLKLAIAEREKAEQALKEQTEELSAIYENAPLVMMIVNASRLVLKINNPISAFTTIPIADLVGHPICEVINCIHAQAGCDQNPACPQCAIGQTVTHTFASGVSQHQVQGQMCSLQNGHPQEGFFIISTKKLKVMGPAIVLLCLQDISEQHRLQEQVIQQQKLESLGTLAGGIAHDFNNILSAIMGFTDLAMLREADELLGLREDLAQVRKASTRAKDLVRQILTFSRKQNHEMQPLQISLIIKEALKLLRASIPSTIEIQQEIFSQALVLADPTQIHQVVMNLCTNAYQSMLEGGGVLGVTLQEIAVEQGIIDCGIEIPPGSFLQLTISDTGCGMNKETLLQIFEPYFTTKGIGKGTGLGLSVVHGIVQGHHGHIGVCSEPGRGTTFKVYFPICTENRELTVHEVALPPLSKGHERVMVVDDEKALCDLLCQILNSAGYQAKGFSNGPEAWQALAQAPHDWDLLLTDQTMPGMTGEQLSAKASALRPELPIILCSGYMTIPNGDPGHKTAVFTSLQKPLCRNTLLTEVAKALAHK